MASGGPPKTAVFPSRESAAAIPWVAFPTAPAPTSFVPSCFQIPCARVKIQTAPALALSPEPATRATFPNPERATDLPRRESPTRPVPTSREPCCVQTPAERVKTQAAPRFAPSAGPPTSAVFPSPEIATDCPWLASPEVPVPTSLGPCCSQTPWERAKTQAAPVAASAFGAPEMSVSPSAEIATAYPCRACPTSVTGGVKLPTSFGPCCVQDVPDRVKTQTAPSWALSSRPPTTAVLPSAERAIAEPCRAEPTAPLPTSLAPCRRQSPAERVKTHAAPM